MSNIIEHKLYSKLIKEWHPVNNKNVKLNSFTCGSNKKVWWKCDVADDHEWEARINHRINGVGCPYCSGRMASKLNCLSKTHIELIKEWHPTKNGNLTPNDVVAGTDKKVWWICDFDNSHEWIAVIKSRIRGHNCPHCNESKGEKNIRRILSDNNIIFETQKKFKNCVYKNVLPFDFYLPNHNLLIEYDGIQHSKSIKHFGGEENFELRKLKDRIKTDFAKNNNFKLLRINYTQFKKINEIIINYLCTL